MFKKYAHVAPKSPAVMVSQEGAVTVSGDSKTPSQVGTSSTDTVLPLPKGSTFVFNEKLGTMTLTLADGSQMALNRTETTVKGPVAFDPPKPPTAGELADAEADAKTKIWLYIGLVGGIAAAGVGLIYHFPIVAGAGGCVSASCGFGLMVAKSMKDHPWISHVFAAGLIAGLVALGIYYLKIRPNEPKDPNAAR